MFVNGAIGFVLGSKDPLTPDNVLGVGGGHKIPGGVGLEGGELSFHSSSPYGIDKRLFNGFGFRVMELGVDVKCINRFEDVVGSTSGMSGGGGGGGGVVAVRGKKLVAGPGKARVGSGGGRRE
ncbi:hypothetical protein RND81_11G085500 [Saponaria officinalis]|uniref:Uncharacterized protein n=1 Tax=Saponaria officinalis TaxID=3572 RepID=A0AAW1HJH9_SAPOF